MGPELISDGSFEDLNASFLPDKTDPGTMILVSGTNELRKWTVANGPIALMNNKTTRAGPYNPIRPHGPDAGQYFLDLTGNGARLNGGITQFIETHPGWYQVSLALGMNDATNATSGPVAVDVVFFSLANNLLGLTWFKMDRGEVGYTQDGQWKVFRDEVFVGDDTSSLEKVDEEVLDFLARLHHRHTDPRKTMIAILAHDLRVNAATIRASSLVSIWSRSGGQTGECLHGGRRRSC
jgi:hypothetical protein